nr:nucleotide-binding alpha-beta plait domain-containing protein [Tanacetum cinerariifolium]
MIDKESLSLTGQAKKNDRQGTVKSYRGALNGDNNKETMGMNSEPSIVLGDECVMSKEILNFLFGRVKEFASLANLKVALANEGFMDITIKYMGELWVMMEFKSEGSLCKFKKCISALTWFSQEEFKIIHRGRGYWIRANETPGFTPSGQNNGEDGSHMVEKVNDAQSNYCENPNGSGNGSISSGHFIVSKVPKTGGSMIDLLEEVVKVGQVMGFK